MSTQRRALVTGASGDIGAAVAHRLAADGHHVACHAGSGLARVQALVDAIVAAGGSAEPLAFDVTDADAAARACDALLAAGPIQILVNSAGVNDDAVFPGMTREQWSRVIDVNLNGFFNVTQPLTMPMLRTRWGRIVSISSVAALMGNRGQVNYAAAKSALHGASKSLALELASRGVTVNCVAPGIIEGSMTEGVFDKPTIDRIVPMKRMGSAREVAALVSFLASEEAGYISGQVIAIDGAMA
ncbi:MAG: 3-oxoacyl-ACP reductase FabG [Burkholderiaceae bacterium]|nr:3-oxoacyl-ACP reductase FabG [Burkholderiaceae bacterium]